LFNLVSHAKYVCSGSTDNAIVAMKVIECLHVALAVALCAAALYHGTIERKVFGAIALLSGAVAIIAYIMLAVNCTECVGYGEDILDMATDQYVDSVHTMLDVTSVPPVVSNPAWFKVPENYCRASLLAVPGSTNDYATSKSETCLAWACAGNFVPGSGTLWHTTPFGLLLQALAGVYMIWKPGKPQVPPAKAAPGRGTALSEGMVAGRMNTDTNTILRPRRLPVPPVVYKAVPQDFSF